MDSPDEFALDVFDQIHTVMHLYRSRQLRALRVSGSDLTPMDCKVLGYVARHPGCTSSDLVQRFGRDKAQLARLLKGLRERGLLEAEADLQDKRSSRLRASSQGARLMAEWRQEAAAVASWAAAGLSDAQRQSLLEGLAVLRVRLEDAA